LEAGSLGGLQECANSLNRRRARLASLAQIEHETRIADGLSAKARWCSLAPIQELLDFTK
jgi:hypothetical protein